jgi:oxygen-independent coproporphyrinogen-3 oxidase
MVAKDELKSKYIDYLIKELEMKKEYLKDIETIYIGGGTPSSLSLDKIEKLLLVINKNIDMTKVSEFTFEVNPTDVNSIMATLLYKYNVNRISLGVQTLNNNKLKVLGRYHTPLIVKQAIKTLKLVGINNINADLIYGITPETFRVIKKDIRKVIHYGVTHISTYSLIVEEKTIIGKWINEGKFIPMNEDLEANIYRKVCKYLTRKKFVHYEVSNFCKKGLQSKHNLVYWDNMNYLAIGAGASFYIDNIRYTNVMNLASYFEGIDNQQLNYLETTKLTDDERMAEEMILGLRKIEGVNKIAFFNKFGVDIYQKYPFLSDLIIKCLIIDNNVFIRVPTDKLYLMNVVLVNFI